MLCENINADMPVFLDAVAGAQPDLPDEDVPCQLLRPRDSDGKRWDINGRIDPCTGRHYRSGYHF